MDKNLIKQIVEEIKVKPNQVSSVLSLLDEGNTIPFIARYRKEQTGGLDEEVINQIHKRWDYLNKLTQRKEDIIRLIEEKEMMTPELKLAILNSDKLVELEDLYRPYKDKKKTKATEAVAKGLEPLAKWILSFPEDDINVEATKYINDKVKTVEEAIEGALHIISETISDNAEYRKVLRQMIYDYGRISTTKRRNAVDERLTYQNYYDYDEPVNKIKPHRVLAINRAEAEKIINVKLEVDQSLMVSYLKGKVITRESKVDEYLMEAISDSLKRLIYPSIEREVRRELTEVGEDQAILVFSDNLSNLLLQPPLKGRVVLGVDPAFRTGCKLGVVDEQGTVLTKDVIYPNEKAKGMGVRKDDLEYAEKTVIKLINQYNVELIAIGNGTASRETELFIAKLISDFKLRAKYVIVNEAGASVYSASDIAREEFPDFSVEERSAISIARRLQDPLSELVKIDPKGIGVGQYQHDITPKKLNDSLTFVVTQAVNQVGVNVNTASAPLLTYVSGMNKNVAQNIVDYRRENGVFTNRKQLNKVKGLGAKTYEQAIGFLRVPESKEILDSTGIHPESYKATRLVMDHFKILPESIGKPEIKLLFHNLDKEQLSKDLNVDIYTLTDIIETLEMPLRDPRDQFPQPILKSDVLDLDDLTIGMELQGTVRNVTDFGAFVDVGIKNDGLVHISKLSNSYVKHPRDVVSVGDIVKVYVINIVKETGKVGLSMIKDNK